MLDPFADQPSSDDGFEHDYSICTPPRHQSLEDKLLDTAPAELETLLEKVLEKHPDLRAKLTEPKRSKPEPKPVETVEWDTELTANREMCRDDKGGWIKATDVSKHRIVGTDFRGLPIVHIGRGRHNAKIVKLLQTDPTAIVKHKESEEVEEVNSTAAQVDADGMMSSEAANVPRTSARLQKKRTCLCSSKTEQLSGIFTDLDTAEDVADVSYETDGEDLATSNHVNSFTPITRCDTPPEVISEVSICTSEVKTNYQCPSCHLKLESSESLRKHVVSPDCVAFHSKCHLCQSEFSDSGQLQAHELHYCYQQISTSSSQDDVDQWAKARFRCSLCGAGHSTEQDVMSHARISHAAAPVFQCRLCEQGYHELRLLRKHFSRRHVNRRKHCGKVFQCRPSVQAHMRRQHSNNRLPLHCSVCSKQLKSKRSLQNHMKCVHENDRPFQCEHCGKAFVTRFTLNTHSKIHSDFKDFTCGICGAKFHHKVRLTEHLRAHTGVKDFMCSICKKAFYTRKDLTSHEKSHKKLKTYICEHCGNAYSQVQGLNRHLLTHSDPNQLFKCQFCVKSFKTTGAVYRHCRLLHPDQMTAYCSICSLTFVSNADLNRHNHYKHMSMYDGRAEERTFLSFTAQATDSTSHLLETESLPHTSTSFQCMCGDSFTDMNIMAEHVQAAHPHQHQTSLATTQCSQSTPRLPHADVVLQPDSPPTSCPTVHRLLYSPDNSPASSQVYAVQFSNAATA